MWKVSQVAKKVQTDNVQKMSVRTANSTLCVVKFKRLRLKARIRCFSPSLPTHWALHNTITQYYPVGRVGIKTLKNIKLLFVILNSREGRDGSGGGGGHKDQGGKLNKF